MKKLRREDLLSLEAYAEARPEFRDRVIAHKKHRQVALGEHVRVSFEDRLTIQYQVQEMLRIERIFESSGVHEELAAYNPLVPDGENLKATLMIEYENVDERRIALARLKGIEDRVWVKVADHAPNYAIADEDLDRSNDDKTSAVHFLRFELGTEAAAELAAGASLSMGVDHADYQFTLEPLPVTVRDSLAVDVGATP